MRVNSRVASALVAILAFACGSSTTTPPGTKGPPPDITSISPGRSTLDGGGYSLVRGFGFKTGLSVTVGGQPGKNITFVDKETFSFQVPAGKAGPADLVVLNTDGGKQTFAQAITYSASTDPAPTLSHVLPNSGPADGGTVARIDGTGFAPDGALVLVGGAPATLTTTVNGTLLTARFPGHAGSGNGDVIVINPDGQSAALLGGFAYAASLPGAKPQVNTISPSEGPLAGGNHAVVTATNLGAGSMLFIGGIPAQFEPAAGGLDAVLPAGQHHGLVDVAVTNTDGQSDVLSGAYNYFSATVTVPPAVARVTPGRAPPAGGGTVIVEGDGFHAGAQVLFGGVQATSVTVASAHVLTAVVPAGAAGSADVTVQNSDGGIATFHNGFLYAASSAAAPTVLNTSPNTGPTAGGTVAEIAGGNFQPGAVVIIGGRPAGSIYFDDQGTLVARYPANPAGSADVTVTNPDGKSGTLHAGFAVAASVSGPTPRVNGVTPGGGPLEGLVPVLVTVDGFVPGALVFIGGKKANAAPQGTAGLIATLPPSQLSGNAEVAVTNPDGQSDVLQNGFNYYIGAPVLGGINPNCGTTAGGTAITLTGRFFRPGVSATVGGQPFTGLIRSDSATLSGTTPQHSPGAADLIITNPDGQTDAISGGYFFSDATHPCQGPTQQQLSLTRVVPNNGPTTGGTVITLVGAGFTAGAAVKFGDHAATDVRLLGGGALTCTLPLGNVGLSDVTITLPDNRTSTAPSAFTYYDPNSNLPQPSLTSVAPNAGPNTGGTTVLLIGTNFASGARVFFGPREASLPTLVDSGRLVAVTPESLSGPVDVKVLNVDGKSAVLPLGFAFYPQGAAGSPPLANFLNPRTGSTLDNTAVVISGSGFQAGAEVFVGGVPASGVHLNPDGSLAATFAPQSASTVDVTVTNPDGQSTTISQGFTFSPPAPHLTAISPGFGPLEGGTSVVVTGVGFLPNDVIFFDTTAAGTKVLDNGALFATVPAHDQGIVSIALKRNGVLQDTLTGAFEYRFGYHPGPPPGIVSLNPPTGPTSGGTVLWMTGANFTTGMQVLFNGTSATKVILADQNHAVVYAPPGPAGNADVTVVNPDGQSSALLRGFAYVSDALLTGLAPRLTSATPNQGPESTSTVDVLTGRNFVTGELVFIGAALGSGVKLLSSSIISVTFPPQPAGPVDLAVTHPDGRSAVLPNGFNYLARPTIVDVRDDNGAANGPTAGGTHVLIGGTGFLQGATVTFNRVPATNVQFQSGNLLSATTPAGNAGAVDVQVTNPDGQIALLSGGWLYVPPPVASSMYPSLGPPAGGTIAVISGTGFASGAAVTFGGQAAISVLWGSSTTLVVTTPAGTGSVNVVVKNPDNQQSTLAGKFTYTAPSAPPPTLAALPINPVQGLDTGGTYATITGTLFQPGALAIVGANPLNREKVVSATTITGVTLPNALGPGLVAVTNPDGQSAFVAGAFTFTDHAVAGPPPVISSLVPNNAPAAPAGSTVVVNGSGFQTGVVVYMGGIPAPLNGTSSPTLVNVRTPVGEQPGNVDVVVTNPDGQSFIAPLSFNFTVPPPQLGANSIVPNTGPTSGGTPVKITGSYFRPPVQVFFGEGQAQLDPNKPSPTDSVIYALAPPGLAGAVNLRILNSDGQQTSQSGAYTYLAPPVLLSVSPTSGQPGGGNQVHLTGRFFNVNAADTNSVRFGAAPVTSILTATATDLVVVAPSSTAAGALTVSVTINNLDGQSVTVAGAYVYLPPAQPPVVNGITPAAATLAGSITVTVLGAHFQFGAKVYMGNWDGVNGNPPPECSGETVQSDGALNCVVPAGATPGSVDITLINPNGMYAVLPGAFTYVAGPPPAQLALLSIAPGAGDNAGGTAVIISGQGFLQGAIASLYPAGQTTGGIQFQNTVVVGPTALSARVPPKTQSASNYDVWVQNPGSPPAILLKAWTYGTGTRHWIPQGSRMPLESNSYKYNRGIGGRTTVAWQGVTGDFTHSVTGASDVFISGWSGRNPRLYQGNVDPQGTNAVQYRDVTAINLHNPDGTGVRDQGFNSSNWANRGYYVYEPRVFNVPQLSTWPSIAFVDDNFNSSGFSIFWNSNGTLTNIDYGASPNQWGINDYVGGAPDLQGKMVDFNLDGYADFAFAGEGRNWLALSCGTGFASPYCTGDNLPTLTAAVSPGTVTVGLQGSIYNYAGLQPNVTKLIVDMGANQEIVVPTASNGTNQTITATFTKSHPAGTVVGLFVSTTTTTQVPTVPANGNGIDVTVTLASMNGVGFWYYTTYVFDAGTDQEEWIRPSSAMQPNYSNKTGIFHFYKTHTSASMTVGTASAKRFAYDTSRFVGDTFGQAYSIIAGDIDADGDEDLIVAHPQTTGSIHVWQNNAACLKNPVCQGSNPDQTAYNFTFTEATSATFNGNPPNGNIHSLAYFPTVPGQPADLLVGFDNSPGSSPTGQQERIYVNQGGGKYSNAPFQLPASCTQSARIPQNETDAILRYEVADVDGNGALDVIAWIDVNSGLSGSTTQRPLRLWLNDGHGCYFGQANSNAYGTSGGQIDTLFPNGLAMGYNHILGDLNKDGLPDLILPVSSYQSREYINQSGSFADKTVFNLPDSRPVASATNTWVHYSEGALLTDVNGDGFPDLVISQHNPVYNNDCCNPQHVTNTDGSIRLFLNDQHGNFPIDNSLTNLPTQINNGKTVSALPYNSVSIAAGHAGALSGANIPYPGPDLLTGNMSRWNSAGAFQAAYPTSSPYYNFLANGSNLGAVRLLLNQPDAQGKPTGVFVDGTYPRLPTNAIFLYASAVKFVDLDLDGHDDIIIGRGDQQSIKVWQNTGNGYYVDVTSTAIPGEDYDGSCGNNYAAVRDLQIFNFDNDNLGLPDVLVGGECHTRLLINHSDPVSHTIKLVDETDAPIGRMPNSPSGHSIVVGDYDCNGSPDLYIIDTNGREHVLINSACQQGGPCGFFTDVSTTYLPPASLFPNGSCSAPVGQDCGQNQRAIGLSYDSSNTDILISRYSDDNYLRPYRLLKNTCGGQLKELSLAAWAPLPLINDKTTSVVGGDIFGRHDGNTDLLFLNEYGPRVYQNSP